jgi:hypothetical protein
MFLKASLEGEHMTRAKYSDFYFGASDSLNEVNEFPDEFVATFVDPNGGVASLREGKKFLVLGPKGTGKSAIAWYLKATEAAGSHLVQVRDASSLPLAEIPRLQTGQGEGPQRTVVAWKFILLCNFLELLLRDQACSLNRIPEVMRVTRVLRNFGFMGDAAGKAILSATNATLTIPLPKIGTIYRRESKAEINIFNLIPYLEDWVANATSESRHILMVDGLDSILLNDPKYDESLASLVQAAYTLNQRLRNDVATRSIVLLIRNDVFSRIALSLPDSQKMRDDLSLEMDWRVMSGRNGRNAPLLKIVNAKAGRSVGQDSIQVLDYFEADIQVGRKGTAPRFIPTLSYFLNMTRHTPRDLLRLFEEIRKVEAEGSFQVSEGFLRRDVVREGVLRYATHYFVGAVRNEFAGFEGGPESGAAAISALQSLQRQSFTRVDFEQALKDGDRQDSSGAAELLRLLFFAGAIGNLVRRKPGAESYMQFYHRRDESDVFLKGEFILHNALCHAWAIPYSV